MASDYPTEFSEQEILNQIYDKVSKAVSSSLATILSKSLDSITSRPEGTTYVNISASNTVSATPCIVIGMYVNSTSSGTIKLWDNASAGSGTVLNNTITPAIGYHPLGFALTGQGVYATIANTLDVTLYIIPVS